MPSNHQSMRSVCQSQKKYERGRKMETGPPRNQKPVAVHTTRAHFAAYTPPGLNRSTPSSCWLCSDVLLFYARLSATGGAPSQQLQQSVDPVLFARAIEASLHTLHTACGYEFRRSPPSHTWRLFFVNTGPRIKKAKQETIILSRQIIIVWMKQQHTAGVHCLLGQRCTALVE